MKSWNLIFAIIHIGHFRLSLLVNYKTSDCQKFWIECLSQLSFGNTSLIFPKCSKAANRYFIISFHVGALTRLDGDFKLN